MLPDLLCPGLDILFCGTAAGERSAKVGHYYAGPGNRFWRLLAEAGITPRRLTPGEDHLMPGLGLGLTDLAKGVSGMDKHIPEAAYRPATVLDLVARWRPRALAFTSLKAARTALGSPRIAPGPLANPFDFPLTLWALSSPSGANGHFDPASWMALGQWLAKIRRPTQESPA